MNEVSLVNQNSDEYIALLEECKAIITEGVWSFRLERILTYGKLGERIAEDELYKRYGIDNGIFLFNISKEIGISYSDICRAVQFYNKYHISSPDSEHWSDFAEGKNISWSKIKQKYLPVNPKTDCVHMFEEIKAWRCSMCKKVLTYNPIKTNERTEEQRTI